MGVSGSGKSTIAQELAARLGWAFEEGDALHPESNVAKMHAAIALTDEDRQPWLERVDGQLFSAYGLLEAEIARTPVPADQQALTQADLTTAVVWAFTQHMLPGKVAADAHPALAAFAAAIERFPVFRETPLE